MIYAYVRVSRDTQTTDNQRFEILRYADSQKWLVDAWVDETVTGTKRATERKLGTLLNTLQQGDVLLVSELSRLGRSLMEIISILHSLMEKEVKVYAVKEGYELGDTISSKVLAFAFGLSAELERKLIAERTREALAYKKSMGVRLGRPPGSLSKKTKLTGKENEISNLLAARVPIAAIARIYGVQRMTAVNFIASRKLAKKGI